MTLDCTDIFCGADVSSGGLAAAGNSGGQKMRAGHPVAGTVAPRLSTNTVQTVP